MCVTGQLGVTVESYGASSPFDETVSAGIFFRRIFRLPSQLQ
jgi:hypothetical protein